MTKPFRYTIALLLLNTICYGQDTTEFNKIHTIPLNGKIVYDYKNSLLTRDFQVLEVLRTSDDPVVAKYVKQHRRTLRMFDVIGGIGFGFAGILLINVFSSEFYSPDPHNVLWRRILVGTSLSFSGAGLLIRRSAKKKMLRGVERFNRTR